MAKPNEDSVEKKTIRMTGDRILLRPGTGEGERRSRAGILIPATAELARRLTWAEVVALGPSVRNIEPGDSVLYAAEEAMEVEIKGELYVIIRERQANAIASATADEGTTGLYL